MSLTLTLILFLIMDPVGNVSSYLSMVRGLEPQRQHYVVIREMLIALGIMVLFNFVGEFVFSALQITEVTVRIASGVILFLIALKILFASPTSLRANLPHEEPFIIPLAVPLIAGPSLLATIMLYAHTESQWIMLSSIFVAWIFAVLVLYFSAEMQRILGTNGLVACEKLMGMLLVLMGIQRFLEGVSQYIPQYCTK